MPQVRIALLRTEQFIVVVEYQERYDRHSETLTASL